MANEPDVDGLAADRDAGASKASIGGNPEVQFESVERGAGVRRQL